VPIKVYAKPGEDLKSLLPKFKKAVDKSGVLKIARNKARYEKPSDKANRLKRQVKKYGNQQG